MTSIRPSVALFDAKQYDRAYFAKAEGYADFEWYFHESRLRPDTVSLAQDAQAACVFVNDTVDRPVLSSLSELGVKMVALRCAGFNNVDLAAAKELGIQVVRVPAYSPHAVAEHTVALILALNRKIHKAYNRVRDLNFSLDGLVGFDLHGKTAGLLGTGRIGRIVGQILRGFGMRVWAFDPYPSLEWAARNGIEYVDPALIAAQSDIITLHIPLTPETHHVINEQTLKQAKPGCVLVNVSRGGLIDTKALIAALKRGQLGGVALDVYEEEEGVFFEDLSAQVLQDDVLARLLTFPNVLITSHQAFLTEEALREIAETTVSNILRSTRGDPLLDGTTL